jgi:hypothetical protein
MANGGQLSVKHTAGVHRELCNEFIAACTRKPPWSTKAFVCTVREIEYHDVVSCGIFTDEFPDQHPLEWMMQAVITLEDTTEVYMVEVTAGFHC